LLHTLWSVKGGSGVTVLSAALASISARRVGRAVIVDLGGDQPAALGVPEPSGPGLADWLATPDGSEEALERLLVPAGRGTMLLPRGRATECDPSRHERTVGALRRLGCPVVVDAGLVTPRPPQDPGAVASCLIAAGRSILVIRPCYLALRRAVSSGVAADGVVLVQEPGRALDRHDVSQVLGLPVLGRVELDPAVARSVDAGLLTRRPSRSLERQLRGLT
jgi:hypothetical protein